MAGRAMELKVVSLGRVYGPVPVDKLVQLAQQGRISAEDLVRPVGTETWYRADEVPALAASLLQPSLVLSTEGGPAVDLAADADSLRAILPVKKPGEDLEMDMAPMIDVTFLLLIFFMLTNSLANPSPMDVPTAVHGRGVTLEGQQLVLVDGQGGYFLGESISEENRAASLESLIQEVRANADASRAPMDVIVNAHKKSNYLQIRELVEQLGSVQGLGEIMLGVEEQLQ
jgi:biopolymer transport protein ExbD